jgi:hypothetical protein
MAVTSYKTPSTTASVDRDAKAEWTDPNFAQASDNQRTFCVPDKSDYGDWLRCTNFGFSTSDIPSGSTIDGIEVKIERRASEAGAINISALYLRKTSGQVGDSKSSATYWGITDAEVVFGAATDKWNASLVTSDILSNDFGIDLSVYNADTAALHSGHVDCVSIRVYYTVLVGRSFGVIIG